MPAAGPRDRSLVPLCLALALAAGALDVPLRFDMAPAAIAPADGYVLASPASLYSAGAGFGFETAPAGAKNGDAPCQDVLDRADDERAILKNGVLLSSGTAFRVDLAPHSKVRVRAVLASIPHYYGVTGNHYVIEPTDVYGLEVYATKGAAGLKRVADDVDLRTPYAKGSVATDHGSYRKLWFTATADSAGTLRIRFDAPGAGALIPLAALEIYAFQALPLVYQRAGGGYLASTVGAVPGLDGFNAGDAAALYQAAAEGPGDPLLRATALLWCRGWLDGDALEYAGADALAAELLADPALVDAARAIELCDQLEDFRLGELHYGLLAYSAGSAAPPAGYGYFDASDPDAVFATPVTSKYDAPRHLYLAETLFRQIAGASLAPILQQNAGTNPDPDFEVAPLSFRALDRIARIWHGMNPTHSYLSGGTPDANFLYGLDLAEAIWRGFDDGGFLALEFAGNAELAALAYMARPEVHHHEKNGGLLENWNGADVASAAFDLDGAWWQGELEPPSAPDPNVPAWASAQRAYLRAFRGAAQWWFEQRQRDGEFGGGPGDDPELLGLLAPILAGIRPADDAASDAAVRAAVDAQFASELVDDGYYAGAPTDVEHSAEFTSYPLSVALLADPTDPALLQAALDVARHLAAPHAPAEPWAVLDPSGHLRFRSFWFTAAGPPDGADPLYGLFDRDVPLNGRALQPALAFLGVLRNPTLESDLLSWVDGWRAVALQPDAARPKGLVPASVRASDLLVGDAGQWWKASPQGGSYHFPSNVPAVAALYGAYFGAAHKLAPAGGAEFLVPMVRLLKSLAALDVLLDAGAPPGDVGVAGTSNWALYALMQSQDFWNAAAELRAAILGDAWLRAADDPDEAGTAPYVTDAFAAAFDGMLAQRAFGYPAYLAVPQGPIDVAGGTYGRKGKTALTSSLQRGAGWLENYFPLGTSLALFTDRAFLFNQGSHETLFGMLTGGTFTRAATTRVVAAERAGAAAADLDVAILVNDLGKVGATDHDRLRVLVWNFGAATTLRLRLWNRLGFGSYAVRTGKALTATDWFAGGAYAESVFAFERRGQALDVAILGGDLTLVELERTAAGGAAAGFDLALGELELAVEAGASSGAPDLVVRALAMNLGSEAIPAAGVRATLELWNGDAMAKQAELPLAGGFAALPAVDGYDLPQVEAELRVALAPPLVKLLALGRTLRVRFENAAGADLVAENDAAAAALDLEQLLELAAGAEGGAVELKVPKVPANPKKAKKAAAKALKQWVKSLPK